MIKNKYIIVGLLILVYFMFFSTGKKEGLETIVAGEVLASETAFMGSAAAMGYGQSDTPQPTKRKKSNGFGFINKWTIFAAAGLLIYFTGGLDTITKNPTLLMFGVLAFGVMAIMK